MEGGKKPAVVLSEEDKALLNKINRDSFYQRSLPLSVLCAGSVLVASQRGMISKGVKLKTFVAGFTGFMLGKFSYAGQLQERFLKELPHSEVSKILRQQRGLPEPEMPPPTSSSEDDLSYFQSKPEEPYVLNPIGDSHSGRNMSYDELRQQHQKRYKDENLQNKEPGFYIPQHELARMEAGQNQPLFSHPEPTQSTRQQQPVN